MKKNIITLLSLSTTLAMSIVLFSCGDDDPPAKGKLSFTAATSTVNESDGTIEIEVALDKTVNEDVTIEYTLKGTASEKSAVSSNTPYDYEDLNEGEVVIKKGEKTGVIELELFSDPYLEDPETIEIDINTVSSKNVEITREDETEITVDQEDGLVITLTWPAPSSGKQADMDMFIWIGESASTLEDIFTGSVNESFQPGELVFIPYVVSDVSFGAGYVYYDGTLDPLNFTVKFIDIVNGQIEAEAQRQTFTGTYTAINLNKWTDPGTTKIVQNFKKSGTSFTGITQIGIPTAGSRLSQPVLSSKKFARSVSTKPTSKLYNLVRSLK